MVLRSFPWRLRFSRAAQISGSGARGTRAIAPPPARGRLAPALLAVLTLGGCGPDGRQVRLCERVFAELEDEAERANRIGTEALDAPSPGVALLFRARTRDGPARRFVCHFRGARFAPGQAELASVTRLSGEPLSDLALQHLRRRVGLE
jgi:hypothetical protein